METYDGEKYFVVWQGNCIKGQFISKDGSFADTVFSISQVPHISSPRVTWNGTYYFVSYIDEENSPYGSLGGQWVSKEGILLGSPFKFGGVFHYIGSNHNVAWNGDHFLVVFEDDPYMDPDSWVLGNNDIGQYGVEENSNIKNQISKIEVFPNPFIQQAAIRQASAVNRNSVMDIRVYDIGGRLVGETDKTTIGKNLKAGIYFVKVNNYKPIKIVKIGGVK